jgi:hypothetical protein
VDATLTGPGIWFINIVGIVSGLMAVFICVDAWRGVRASALPDSTSKLIWVGPQALYIAALVATITPGVLPSEYRWIVLAATPIAVILQFSYLLKVVYPKQAEGADTASSADEASSQDG